MHSINDYTLNLSLTFKDGYPIVEVHTPTNNSATATRPPSTDSVVQSSPTEDAEPLGTPKDAVASWAHRYASLVEHYTLKTPKPILEAIKRRSGSESRYSDYLVLGYNSEGQINLYNQTTRSDGARGMRNSIKQAATDTETLAKLRAVYYLATRVHGIPIRYGDGYQAKAVDSRDNVYRLIDPAAFESDDFQVGDFS